MKRPLHGGSLWEDGIDFSANINPLGLPHKIKTSLHRNFDDILHYPQPYANRLRKALALYVGLREENILVGNGSIELIYLIFERLRPRHTLLAYPTFNEYEYAARLYGSKLLLFKEPAKFQSARRFIAKSDLFFICNPNNPTGYLYPKEFLYEALDVLKGKGGTLVIDEAFIEFVKDSPSFINEVKNYTNLIVLRSFTKFFCLAGLRLGYLACDKRLNTLIGKAQYPWAANALAQGAALALLKDTGFIRRSQCYVQRERNYLFNELNKLDGIIASPPTSNFLFCKVRDGKRLCSELAKRKLFLRNLADFRGLNGNFLRIAVRRHSENELLVKNIIKLHKNQYL